MKETTGIAPYKRNQTAVMATATTAWWEAIANRTTPHGLGMLDK